MRIVVLPSWYPTHSDDSAGIFFREQAAALAKTGLQVEVLSPCRISLREILRRRKPLAALPGLSEKRCSYIGPPRMPRFDEILWRAIVRRLYSNYLIQHGPPDILHAHSLYPAGILAAELPARARILTEHLSTLLGPQGPRLAARASSAMSHFAARIAVGPGLTATMERLAPRGSPWICIPNLVNTEFFTPTRPPSLPVRVLTVCNLTPNKRVDWMMRAFDCAFGSTDAELWIVGEGDERRRLQRQAFVLRSASRIRFLGQQSRSQVRDLLNQCTIFALASRHETLGVVLLEAMAMGRPVISTNSGGPSSIVTDEVGTLVDVDDLPGFAEGMRNLVLRLNAYSQATIRNYCQMKFGEQAVTSRLIAVYDEALRGG